jgi:hypothetical protein
MAGTNSQQWLVTATFDGQSAGKFDTVSGGEITADVQKHRPGGMSDQISFPAMSEYGDLTFSRYWDAQRDGDLVRRLRGRVGLAEVTVTAQALGRDKSPLAGAGSKRTYVGTLSGLTEPESDSNSADVSMVEFTVVVEAVS